MQNLKSFDTHKNSRLLAIYFVTLTSFLSNDGWIQLRKNDVVFPYRQNACFVPSGKGDESDRGIRVVIAWVGKETCPVTLIDQYLQIASVTLDSDIFCLEKCFFFII